MCGIAGILSADGSPISDQDIARLAKAGETMRRRGPDGDGLWIDPSRHAALAHRRLAIIDPTPEASQPMISSAVLGSGGNAISFNGEIYNFNELRSNYKLRVPPSDTAVLLALLESRGVSILPELRGFFTFAYWNEKSRQLIIGRDAIGKKPLYYGVFGNKFVFASELRALVASRLANPVISRSALASYLRFYSVPHPDSIFEGISFLPPRSILRMQVGGTPVVEQWYRLPKHDAANIAYKDAVHETRRILERSVRDRLVSDVPVGAFLSGGLDSNAIVALAMRESANPIETFSIGFENPIAGNIESETKWAAIGAKKYGTTHHERIVSVSDAASLLPDFFKSMDSPTGDGLNIFLVSKAAREASPNLKVVLSGVGGDEAFLGYRKYRALAKWSRFFQPIWMLTGIARAPLADALMRTKHSRLRAALRTGIAPENTRHLFSPNDIASLTGQPKPAPPHADAIESGIMVALLRHDIEHYLPDMLLRDLDVFTMSQSFEARAPLLDKELMEFCWQLPMALKSRGASKQLLMDAVLDILPAPLLNKPKTGFELPMRDWLLRGELRPYLDTLVSGEMKLVSDGFLSRTAVSRVHADFLKGRSHYLKPWSIVALEHWYRAISFIL